MATACTLTPIHKAAHMKSTIDVGSNVNDLVTVAVNITVVDTITATIVCQDAALANIDTPFPMMALWAKISCTSAASALASSMLPYAIPADSTTEQTPYGKGYAVTVGNLTASQTYVVEITGVPVSLATSAT